MKNLGNLLLAAWLILWGLKSVIGLNFNYDYMVLGILAIVAGVFVAIRR
jgi:hypothetical protein